MKPKNVMLLGFVNRAIEYLDKHMDEEPNTRLSQLKNIDLASIKEELNDHLDASLGTMQSTMSTLLKAGNEAFDEFVIGSYGVASVPEQLDKMFDVDFDEETAVSKQDELAKLLSFYNLDLDIDEPKYHEDDLSVNDDAFMNEIIKNASNDIVEEEVEQPLVQDNKNDEEIDSIFNEIVENENNDVVVQEPRFDKEKEEIKALINELREKLEKEEQARKEAEAKLAEEQQLEAERNRPYLGSFIDQLKEKMIKDEEYEKILKEQEAKRIAEEQARLAEEEAKRAEEERIANEKLLAEQARIAEEKLKAEEEAKLAEDKRIAEEQARIAQEEAEANKPYVSSLIEELKAKLEKEKEDNKHKENKNKPVYDKIANKYTHLPMNFIRSVYDLKESFSYDYTDGQNLIVLHRISFKDVEDLRRFVEISMNHNYNVNADEKKLIVDVFREIENADGKIITNIFEIANQAFILNGEYEGYNVINNEI